jgi:MFS family permease
MSASSTDMSQPDTGQEPQRSFLHPTASSAAALTVVALPSFLLGAFAPTLKEELDFGDTALGMMFTIGYLVSAGGLQLAGTLSDQRGPALTIRAGIAIAGAGSLAIAFGGSSYLALLFLFTIVRFGESLVHPGTNTMVSQAVPPRQQGRSLGIKQAAIPFATALAGLAVPLAGDTIGWQATFAIVAALSVPVLFSVPANTRAAVRRTERRPSLWRLPHLRLLGLGGAFAAASVVTVAGFLTTAAEDAGYSEGQAGLLLALGGVIMVVSRLSWGLLADRYAFDRFMAVAGALGVGSVAYLLFATQSRSALVVGTVLVFGIGWSWPGVVLLGVIELHPDAPGAASAVIQTSVRLGALGAPLVFGVVADRSGFGIAWLLSFGFALAGMLCVAAASVSARRFSAASPATL